MNRKRIVFGGAGGLALLGAAVGVACGGSSAATTAGEAGGEAGGEAALVSATDPASGLAFQHPGTWTKTSDRPIAFSGQDEYVSLEVRPLTGDVLAAAKADGAAVQTANPGYKSAATIALSKEVKSSAVSSYEWDLAKSAVTGKPVHERADRYYIDLGNGKMAILTGSSPATRFDREQVRDIALSVKVAK